MKEVINANGFKVTTNDIRAEVYVSLFDVPKEAYDSETDFINFFEVANAYEDNASEFHIYRGMFSDIYIELTSLIADIKEHRQAAEGWPVGLTKLNDSADILLKEVGPELYCTYINNILDYLE